MLCSHKNADPKIGPYCPHCGTLLFESQDESRIYTPEERQLAVRLDCTTMRG